MNVFFRLFNNQQSIQSLYKRTLIVEEFGHVAFDESNDFNPLCAHDDEDVTADLRSSPTPNIEAFEKIEEYFPINQMVKH